MNDYCCPAAGRLASQWRHKQHELHRIAALLVRWETPAYIKKVEKAKLEVAQARETLDAHRCQDLR